MTALRGTMAKAKGNRAAQRTLAVLAAALLALAPAAAAKPEFTVNQSDPEGDVYEAAASGGQGSGSTASWKPVEGHADVDLLGASSRLEGAEVVLKLHVAGQVRDDAKGSFSSGGSVSGGGFGYNWALDVRGDGEEEYTVAYSAREAKFRDEATGSERTVPATRAGATLTVRVPVASLNTTEHFRLTASAVESEVSYSNNNYRSVTYVDVIGPYPGFEAVFEASGGAQGGSGGGDGGAGFDVKGAPGPGLALLALACVGGAVLAARRR